jgi:thiamine kinase-like enzyme
LKAYSLFQKYCLNQIKHTPLAFLDEGADGDVYELPSNKVIKFCVLYSLSNHIDKEANDIRNVLEYITRTQPRTYARVYEFSEPNSFLRQAYDGEEKFYLYYYVMEKLFKLTEDEKKVFHSIISHEDRNILKNYSGSQLKKMLAGMGTALDFDAEKITFFYHNARNCGVQHNDIHVRNIMKTAQGDFKLIDFDRASLENK